jgi:hypothetical protein
MPQTIGSPNPQNGPSNPWQYHNSGGSNGLSSGSGSGSYNIGTGISSIGITATSPSVIGNSNTMYGYTLSIPRTVLTVEWDEKIGDIIATFAGEENGVQVKMVLSPEVNISTLEQHRISLLMSSCAAQLGSPQKVMAYVRKHSLERHFKFSQA